MVLPTSILINVHYSIEMSAVKRSVDLRPARLSGKINN